MKNKTEDYRRLPINEGRYYIMMVGKRHPYLKTDELGVVVEATKALEWSVGKDVEAVINWCNYRGIVLKKMHGNIINIRPYLR